MRHGVWKWFPINSIRLCYRNLLVNAHRLLSVAFGQSTTKSRYTHTQRRVIWADQSRMPRTYPSIPYSKYIAARDWHAQDYAIGYHSWCIEWWVWWVPSWDWSAPIWTDIPASTIQSWSSLLRITICFSVYLFDESRLTASMYPKSMSWPSRKMNNSLHTYFFFWYPSNVLSPNTASNVCKFTDLHQTFELWAYIRQLFVDSFQFGFFTFAVANIGDEHGESAHSIALHSWHRDGRAMSSNRLLVVQQCRRLMLQLIIDDDAHVVSIERAKYKL